MFYGHSALKKKLEGDKTEEKRKLNILLEKNNYKILRQNLTKQSPVKISSDRRL